jgi:hypothetical protein
MKTTSTSLSRFNKDCQKAQQNVKDEKSKAEPVNSHITRHQFTGMSSPEEDTCVIEVWNLK